MSRLIDVDALIKSVQGYNDAGWLEEQVDKQPTVDAVPVVHAHWIQVDKTMIIYIAGRHNGKTAYLIKKMNNERKRCCCNCDHRLKDIKHCDIDDAYINYITCFNGWCHHWTNKIYRTLFDENGVRKNLKGGAE